MGAGAGRLSLVYSPGVRSCGIAGLCPLPSAPTGEATTSPSTSIAPCTLSNGSASTTCSAGLINGPGVRSQVLSVELVICGALVGVLGDV